MFLVVVVCFFTGSVLATDFYDDFQIDRGIWKLQNSVDPSSVSFTNDGLRLSNVSNYFPLLLNEGNVFPEGDYTLTVKFKFTFLSPNGDGFGIGYKRLENSYLPQIAVWQDTASLLHVFYKDYTFLTPDCSNINSLYDDGRFREYHYTHTADLDWHILEIKKTNKSFSVFLDKDSNPLPILVSTTGRDQCVPDKVFFGNDQEGSYWKWNDLLIDHISIVSDNITPTPTPSPEPTIVPTPTLIPTTIPTSTPTRTPTSTPTPLPTPTIAPSPTAVPIKPKIVILPGLGGSWNSEAMIYNLNVLPKDWEMTPFVHDYDNLVEAFVNNGYREGVDLFVWNYDWRKNILEIQNNLNNFIVQKMGPEDKFVLIGHSLGGLVARDWVQYHMDPRLLKLITLGSPHSGVVSAYEAWAGGKVIDYDKFSLQSLMTNLLFQTWRIKYSSDIETVRTVMPVLKDISPTFDFVKKNGQQLPLASLTYKNDYIIGRNLEVSNIFPFLSARVASGAETKSRVLLSEQDLVDKVLNKWGDGSFDGYEYADGDGTILTTSAKISGDSFIQLQATHRKMVDLSVNNIMNELQLRPLAILKQNEDPTENGAVFFIGSPAYLEVDCTGYLTKTSDKFGFVSFPILKNDDKCKLKVVGTGNGAFHVFASYHDSPNVWEKYEGTISKGQVINLSYRVIGNSLVLDQESNNQLWEIIKLKLKNLHKTYLGDNNLDQAYKAAEKKNWLQTLRWTYEFSNKSKEKAVSWSILEDLYHLTPDVLPISQSAAKAYLVVGKAHVKKIYTWLSHHKLHMYEKQEIELASNWGREIDNLYKSGDFASLWKRVKMLEVVVAGLGPATFPM